MQLQRKVKVEKFFGGANRKERKPIIVDGKIDKSMLNDATSVDINKEGNI